MENNFQQKWNKCLELIKANVGIERFNAWFTCAKPVSYVDGKLTLFLPSTFFYEKYEDTFYNVLHKALKEVFGKDIKLGYEVPVVSDNSAGSKIHIEESKHSPLIKNKLFESYSNTPIEKREMDFDPQLNSSLTFENYCVGESNKLPLTIAQYIADNPGKGDFNPFFIYGNVGVGKTHLIQAIGIRIKERNPNARVLFIPIRKFSTLYQQAYRDKKIPEFINWFQTMDVLLFDDLQELEGKPGTAEILFPIFNHLKHNKKDIVFTCDRPPVELDGLQDRLIDRFKWGMVESLPDPDLELRKKILSFKSVKNGLGLPNEVIDLIATNIESSVRELENVVNGLLMRSIALNVPITTDLARDVMRNIARHTEKKPINFEMIVESTADFYNLSTDAIFSRSRVRDVADARQMIMYLANKHTSLTSSAIGRKLNRTHATVLHNIDEVKKRLTCVKELADEVLAIEKDLFR